MTNTDLIKMLNNMVNDIAAMGDKPRKITLHNNFISLCNDMRDKEQITDGQFNLCKETLSSAVVR